MVVRNEKGMPKAKGEADLVQQIYRIGSTEGNKAAGSVRNKLSTLDVPNEWPDDWIDVAIRTVCAGTMKSFTENDLGILPWNWLKNWKKRWFKRNGGGDK